MFNEPRKIEQKSNKNKTKKIVGCKRENGKKQMGYVICYTC